MSVKQIIAFLLVLLAFGTARAQKQKIAVFAPLYLDSAFDGANYKLGTNNLPKQILPGLDFYNGVLLAVDSLNKEFQPLDIYFYDTKSIHEPIELILEKEELKDVSLLIAAFNNRSEIKYIADFALEHKVPLISMTYPNDGGITDNPYFVLVNPTLKTHIEAIHKYLQRIYPTEPIIYFKKAGAAEDMIAGIFADLNKRSGGVPLKIRTVALSDSFSTQQVLKSLDTSRQNIVLCGSLNEQFGTALAKSIGSNKSFKSLLVGMPTWDGLRDIGKDVDIIYTTPYNYNRTDKVAQSINNSYRTIYAGRPSDMVFKAYEAVYRFGKLLVRYRNNLLNHISDKDIKLFNDFDFQPVQDKNENRKVDYLENKKLYFIRKTDGQIKSIQ